MIQDYLLILNKSISIRNNPGILRLVFTSLWVMASGILLALGIFLQVGPDYHMLDVGLKQVFKCGKLIYLLFLGVETLIYLRQIHQERLAFHSKRALNLHNYLCIFLYLLQNSDLILTQSIFHQIVPDFLLVTSFILVFVGPCTASVVLKY